MATEFLYGRRPVYEALRAGRRAVKRLLVAEGSIDSGGIVSATSLAEQQGIAIETVRRDALDARVGGANHQGIVLEAGGYRYVEVDAMLEDAERKGEPPLLLVLDLLQDVQNVGTLLRTADAVGVHGVIIQERRAADITPAVVGASSGAVEHLHVARVTNIVRTMADLKECDVWFAGLDLGEDAVRLDQANLDGSLGLVVGSEGSGLRRLVRETCDFIVYLPMRGRVASLNAATAGSLALYAVWQARGFRGEA
jgi:23S rRNA (guanosine2251-2'-O)-methyltransferase